MEIISDSNEHFNEPTLFEPIINNPINIKKKVGRKPMNEEEKLKKHTELLVKRRQYAKTYYDKGFKYVRRLIEINDTYKIPDEILKLPQDTPENAQIKVELCKTYIKNLKSSFKTQLFK